MFKLILYKQIHACFAAVSSGDVYLKKELSLPFAPFVGLGITDGNFETEIECVYWDVKKENFICYTHEDKELYEADLHDLKKRDINEIIKNYTDYGWEIRCKEKT